MAIITTPASAETNPTHSSGTPIPEEGQEGATPAAGGAKGGQPKGGLDAIVDAVEADGKPAKAAKAADPKEPPGKAAADPKAPPPAAPQLHEVKVNGKTFRLTTEELIARAQLAESATSRFEEAAKSRKQVEGIIANARQNPIEALMDPALGLTKDQIRDAFESWYAREYIDPTTLTPEQLELRDAKAKLKSFEDADKAAKAKTQAEEQEKLTTKQMETLQSEIVEAMEASGLPKTKFFVSRMAFYMRQNLINGWKAPISVVVSQVRKERQEIMSDLTDSSDAETLIATLGDGVVNKIRSHDLKKLREKRAPSFMPPADNGQSDHTDEKVDYSEVKRAMRRQWGV